MEVNFLRLVIVDKVATTYSKLESKYMEVNFLSLVIVDKVATTGEQCLEIET